MKTMEEVAARSRQIQDRMREIQKQIRLDNSLYPDEVFTLLKEFGSLVQESQMISASVEYHKDMTEHLLSVRCSGPH